MTGRILFEGYMAGYLNKEAREVPPPHDGAVPDEDFDPNDLGSNVMTVQGGQELKNTEPLRKKMSKTQPGAESTDKYAKFVQDEDTPLEKAAGDFRIPDVRNESVFGPEPTRKPKVRRTSTRTNVRTRRPPVRKPAPVAKAPVKKTPPKQYYQAVAPNTAQSVALAKKQPPTASPVPAPPREDPWVKLPSGVSVKKSQLYKWKKADARQLKSDMSKAKAFSPRHNTTKAINRTPTIVGRGA